MVGGRRIADGGRRENGETRFFTCIGVCIAPCNSTLYVTDQFRYIPSFEFAFCVETDKLHVHGTTRCVVTQQVPLESTQQNYGAVSRTNDTREC
jgi:hypothetical protein